MPRGRPKGSKDKKPRKKRGCKVETIETIKEKPVIAVGEMPCQE